MEILIFVLGSMIGLMLALAFVQIRKPKPVGTLRVDTSDPDGPYLFLELHTGVGDVMQQKQVILDVNVKDYISHK